MITRISLTNFKNYASIELEIQHEVVAFLGNNGMGKTNLLDALYYSCLGKSYFSSRDRIVLKKGEDFFRIKTSFLNDEKLNDVLIKVVPGKLKEIGVDGVPYTKQSDHVGRFPTVIIAPLDVQLLLEGSEPRRLFMNNSIVQYSKKYLDALIMYNRLLKQRNALLKKYVEQKVLDKGLLNVLSNQMVPFANLIFEHRASFVERISPIFNAYYHQISGGNEDCSLHYKSGLTEDNFLNLLEQNLEKDKVLGRTTSGVHKDDLVFKMNDEKLKIYASQGQLKTYVLALKLAQYSVLKSNSPFKPLLLLDDLFDKLDKNRVGHLLELITNEEFGQVFITDTNLKRIPDILNEKGIPLEVFHIENGDIITGHA